MKNYQEFSKAVQTLDDERKSRWSAASHQRDTASGGDYSPPELSPQARQAERTIISTCQSLLDTAGHDFSMAQLNEWMFWHRSKSFSSHDPILVVADFVNWQASEIGPQGESRESRETVGGTSATTRGNSPRS